MPDFANVTPDDFSYLLAAEPGSRWNNQGIDVTNNRMIITGGSNADGPFWRTWVLSDADNV